MMRRVQGRLAIGLLAVTLGGNLVFAQQKPVEPPEEKADLEVPIRKRAEISPRDMLAQANGYLDGMKGVLTRIVQLQEVARRQKDVIRLNCVNDKLLQVKQLLNIAEAASTNLQEAVARGDEEARYHEFGRITIAHQQVAGLGTEAENCVGEDLSFLGPTEVVVEQPDQPDDPTLEPTPEFPVVEPPPIATPFV